MIELTAFLRRDRLREILARWFHDELHETDASELKRIINFNDVIVRRYLRDTAEMVMREAHGVTPSSWSFRTKGALKDFVVERCSDPSTARVAELARAYRRRPSDFYPETPVEGRMYYLVGDGGCTFLGSARMKRFRRIAEKGARRVSDYVFEQIRAKADESARDRARAMGVSFDELVSTPQQVLEEFVAAEETTREKLRRRKLHFQDVRFEVNDVAGVKIVAPNERHDDIVHAIEDLPAVELLEREEHRGQYWAVNLTLAVELDPDRILTGGLTEQERAVLVRRGFQGSTVGAEMEEFVRAAERTVRMEVILSDFQNFFESELGASMHEQRILWQRQNQLYRGPLSRNAEYLLAYVFAFALSPTTSVASIPIKPWGRYLVDYFDHVLRELSGEEAFTLGF